MVRATTVQVLAELAVVVRLSDEGDQEGGITSPPDDAQGAVRARQIGAHAHPP